MRGNEFRVCVRPLNITYEAVVLAADGASLAGVAAAHTDDVDRRASQADKTSNVPGSDADEFENLLRRSRVVLKSTIS